VSVCVLTSNPMRNLYTHTTQLRFHSLFTSFFSLIHNSLCLTHTRTYIHTQVQNLRGSSISCMCTSSSSKLIAFGDSNGIFHQWCESERERERESDPRNMCVNVWSTPIQLPTPQKSDLVFSMDENRCVCVNVCVCVCVYVCICVCV